MVGLVVSISLTLRLLVANGFPLALSHPSKTTTAVTTVANNRKA
jgi:hypothetical protein